MTGTETKDQFPKPIIEWSLSELENMVSDRDGLVRLVKQEDGSIHVFEPTNEEYDAMAEPTQLVMIVPSGEEQMFTLCTYLTAQMGFPSFHILCRDLLNGEKARLDVCLMLAWPQFSLMLRPEIINEMRAKAVGKVFQEVNQ